jgi:conjugal transfer pilus assembly protein TraF
MSRRLLILFFSLIAALFAMNAPAETQEAERTGQKTSASREYPFYAGPERRPGWWWNNYKPEKEEQKEDAGMKEEKRPDVPPPLTTYGKGELWTMHPDLFEPLTMAYRKKAVQDPTEENVRDYYEIQDIARRRALAYMNVSMMVLQKHPEYSVLKDYPVTPAGMGARVRQQNREIEDRIRGAAEDFALLYFHSAACEYCVEQSKIVDEFVRKYGWIVKRIDVDERPDLASRFGAATVPLLLAIYRGSDQSIPVAAGVTALNDIEESLYRGMRLLSGEITPGEYTLYDFQKKSAFDTGAVLNGENAGPRRPATRREGRQ